MHYRAIPQAGLRQLKEELGYTNSQMAGVFGITTGRQFHKYLSDEDKREMGYHVLMYGMLQIELMLGPVRSIDQLHARARRYGAVIEPSAPAGEPEQSQP
ncbi:hypothetical protein [Paraburkholderia fungorum]|uniref:hypothetical protein n=1 Tax=Paraburkholderia fungorum TaxID=134537 RepID=UPI00161C69FE|nr:hypothetical protein [Paraburkholderia fungorum]MBB5547549.1 hypothetical protein [Paraburkholderia fungorum]